MFKLAKTSAIKARTQALNHLKAPRTTVGTGSYLPNRRWRTGLA